MDCPPTFHFADETGSPLSRDWRPGSPGTYLEATWEEQLLEQQEHLEKEMEEAKKMISGLQVTLLQCVLVALANYSFQVGSINWQRKKNKNKKKTHLILLCVSSAQRAKIPYL